MTKGKTKKPQNWDGIYNLWKSRKIKSYEAVNILKISAPTFYKLVKEEKVREEEIEKQNKEAITEFLMEKYGFTQDDINRFEKMMQEVLLMDIKYDFSISAYLGKEAILKANKKPITSFFNRSEEEEESEYYEAPFNKPNFKNY